MAYSYVQYTGNGATVTFSIPFQYISADYLEVRVAGVLTTAYTLPSASSVQMNVAPAVGAVLDIRRNTPKVARLVDFQDASILTEASLDLSADQAFHVAQETLDDSEAALKFGSDNKYDAGSRVIKNVATPVNSQDAATKNWVETGLTSSVVAAATSASNAATSASAASTYAFNASGSAAAAHADASFADASALTATSKASEADTSAINAGFSASAASTSASNAASSASSASTSASNAASSASAAAASYDSFDDRYLGPKASAPTLDNDGNALTLGSLYWNSTTYAMFVWNGTAWVAPALAPGGLLYSANNLSDVASASTARANISAVYLEPTSFTGDVDTLNTAGLYPTASTATNVPFTNNGNFLTLQPSGGNYSQFAVRTPNAANPELWYRTYGSSPAGFSSWLRVADSISVKSIRGAPVTVATSSYTVLASDSWIIFDVAATVTVTLPVASSNPGRELMIKSIRPQLINSASANVAPQAGPTAATGILPATDGAWATLVSDGTNWVIMQQGA